MRIRICDAGRVRCSELTLSRLPKSLRVEILRATNEILNGKHKPVYTDCFETLCWLEYSVNLEAYELRVWAIVDIASKTTRVTEAMLIPLPRRPHFTSPSMVTTHSREVL